MRIGFFTDRYLPQTDGVVYSLETFRQQLEAQGHEVFIFAPKPLRYRETNKHVIRFPAVKGLFFEDHLTSFFFPPQAMRRIEKLKLDVVHFHTPGQIGLMGVAFALRNHLPLVSTYHTDYYEYVKHYPNILPATIVLSMIMPAVTGGGISDYRHALSSIRPQRNVDKWNQKMVERGFTTLHNHCDLIIAPSAKMERQLKRWKTRSPIAILPTGVDEIATTGKDKVALRKRYHLVPGDETILFVGRIGTEKNLGLLIEAFNLVAAKRPHAKLVITGKGDDLELFKAQAARSPFHNRIIFTGEIAHARLGALYANAHVFAFPSLADTQGLVLNEAAWAKLPIVMIDKGVSDVVRHGENGYYAKNSAKDLAAKLQSVLADEGHREVLGRRSRQLAAEYTASQQASKLLRLYQETIERHREAQPPR